MKAALSIQDITPALPCHMEGYNDRIASKILDPLYMNTLVFQDTEKTVVWSVLDIIMITEDLYERLAQALSTACNLPKENIILSAIHTHSGPKVSTYLFSQIEPDPAYIQFLEDMLVQSVKEAMEHLEPVAASIGEVHQEGFYSNRNNPDAFFNDAIQVLKLEREDHGTLTSLVNMACHPTVLDPAATLISADLSGALRKEISERTGAPAVVFTGEAGDVSTRYTRKGKDAAEISRLANGLAALMEDMVMPPVSLENLQIKQVRFESTYVPGEDPVLCAREEQFRKLVEGQNITDGGNAFLDMHRMLKERLDQQIVNFEFQAVLLETNDLRIVFFPGEILSSLSPRLREMDEKTTLVCCYTNGFNGYCMDAASWGKNNETTTSNFPGAIGEKFIDTIVEAGRQ